MGNLGDGTRDKEDHELILRLLFLYPKILEKLEKIQEIFLTPGLDTPCQNDKAYIKIDELITFIEQATKDY